MDKDEGGGVGLRLGREEGVFVGLDEGRGVVGFCVGLFDGLIVGVFEGARVVGF